MLNLKSNSSDDVQFLEKVKRIIRNTFLQGNTEKYIVCRVDNWFDSKWLGFSGQSFGVEIRSGNRLTFPPFVPNRILEEQHYLKKDDGFIESGEFKPIHLKQWSSDNEYRLIDRVIGSATLVWFSSRSRENCRGSLMVYSVISEVMQNAWYVSLKKNGNWSYVKTVKITEEQLKDLESCD